MMLSHPGVQEVGEEVPRDWGDLLFKCSRAAGLRPAYAWAVLGLLFLSCLSPNFARGGVLTEEFASDPMQRGWHQFGDAPLFRWNSVEQHLEVTWDSSLPNNYFYRRLPTVLTKSDDFTVEFELTLHDAVVGITPGRPFTFEIAIGLFRLADATASDFQRGTASGSGNLVEFDYFPDSGFGATVSPVIVSNTGEFIPGFNFPLELTSGARHSVRMRFTAVDQTLRTVLMRDGAPFGSIKDVTLSSGFTDFRLDAVSVSSFSDMGAGGSIRAHGTVDGIRVEFPDPPLPALEGRFENERWEVRFLGAERWVYHLETSTDLGEWRVASKAFAGTGGMLMLVEEEQVSDPPAMARDRNTQRFYRVRMERP